MRPGRGLAYNEAMTNQYQHLETRQGSLYRQPFIKGTRIRVEIPYVRTVTAIDEVEGEIPGETPAEIAADFHIPMAAVLEAIDYAESSSR